MTGASPHREVRQLLDELRRWLASGRLQSPGGGFCAWRELGGDALAFEYPEITGYALTWLSGSPRPDDREIAAAHAAAKWLSDRLRRGQYAARDEWDHGAIYTFDLAMIAAGLMSFGACVGDDHLTRHGHRLAHRIAARVQPDGILPAVDAHGPPSARPGEWSTAGTAHLAKCAQALLRAGEDAAAQRLIDRTLADQAPDGHFVTVPGDKLVMLHPLFYAVEGLWMWGTACDDDDALDGARRATAWAWQHQLANGGMPRFVSEDLVAPEQTDVTAQAMRAAVLLELDLPVDDASGRLLALACPDDGFGSALAYAPDRSQVHLNAWATMFAAQALTAALDRPGSLPWGELV